MSMRGRQKLAMVGNREQSEPQQDASETVRVSFRQIIEMVICLAIAVILFRGFEVEGYMISTGSMAPSLLGYHKRIECPTCGFGFPFGVDFDESVDDAKASSSTVLAEHHELTACPNCGQAGIDVSQVPRNQGDQLLVHKHAYLFRRPQRWQVAVFRNPQRPQQVYVKRVVGLPGEQIQVREGDVWVNGALQRKGLLSQRAVRIPVFDQRFEPDADPLWSPRWTPMDNESRWKRGQNGFLCRHEDVNDAAVDWLEYRHWLRAAGEHQTAVPLDRVPSGFDQMVYSLVRGLPFDVENSRLQVRFDESAHMLICRGVMRESWRKRLLLVSDRPEYHRAVNELAQESHVGFITDQCSYNDSAAEPPSNPVFDLMLDCRVEFTTPESVVLIEMKDGFRTYTLTLDRKHSSLILTASGEPLPMRSCQLPEILWETALHIEFSLFDRQVLIAINGREYVEPLRIPETWARGEPVKSPLRIGVHSGKVNVQDIALFRDVYYTRGKAKNGVDEPYQLDSDEYFMLGDNSPVSSDSRNWPDGAVAESLLVGRPFVVHLPSRPGKVRWGSDWMHFRLPDFARVRYIR